MDEAGSDIPNDPDQAADQTTNDKHFPINIGSNPEYRVAAGRLVPRKFTFDLDVAAVTHCHEGDRCAANQTRAHTAALQRAGRIRRFRDHGHLMTAVRHRPGAGRQAKQGNDRGGSKHRHSQ